MLSPYKTPIPAKDYRNPSEPKAPRATQQPQCGKPVITIEDTPTNDPSVPANVLIAVTIACNGHGREFGDGSDIKSVFTVNGTGYGPFTLDNSIERIVSVPGDTDILVTATNTDINGVLRASASANGTFHSRAVA